MFVARSSEVLDAGAAGDASSSMYVRSPSSTRRRLIFSGIDGLERFLPSPLLHGRLVLGLFQELRTVDVEARALEEEVRDEVEREELLPVDARLEEGQREDGRIRIRVLRDGDVAQRHGQAEEVQVGVPHGRGVPVELRVHVPFERPPERLVAEERGGEEEREEGGESDRRDLPAPAAPARRARHGDGTRTRRGGRFLPYRGEPRAGASCLHPGEGARRVPWRVFPEREGPGLARKRAVIVLQALVAWLSRSVGRFFQAAFGWAVVALFGPRPKREKTVLSAAVAAAAAWPVLLLGILLPRVATFVLAFVPLSREIDRGVSASSGRPRRSPCPSGSASCSGSTPPSAATSGSGRGSRRAFRRRWESRARFFVTVAAPVRKLIALARGGWRCMSRSS